MNEIKLNELLDYIDESFEPMGKMRLINEILNRLLDEIEFRAETNLEQYDYNRLATVKIILENIIKENE